MSSRGVMWPDRASICRRGSLPPASASSSPYYSAPPGSVSESQDGDKHGNCSNSRRPSCWSRWDRVAVRLLVMSTAVFSKYVVHCCFAAIDLPLTTHTDSQEGGCDPREAQVRRSEGALFEKEVTTLSLGDCLPDPCSTIVPQFLPSS